MIDKILFWIDGDTCELASLGRCRLAKTETPEKYDASYSLAKRTAEHLAPPGSEVVVNVVGRDEKYGRKLVVLRTTGKNINTAIINKFAMFQGQR